MIKKSKKAIYGTTTPEEREELAEEGIDFYQFLGLIKKLVFQLLII